MPVDENGTVTCTSGNTLCTTLSGVGEGFGVLLNILAATLPALLFLFIGIGIVVALIGAIIYVIKRSIMGTHFK